MRATTRQIMCEQAIFKTDWDKAERLLICMQDILSVWLCETDKILSSVQMTRCQVLNCGVNFCYKNNTQHTKQTSIIQQYHTNCKQSTKVLWVFLLQNQLKSNQHDQIIQAI